MKCCFCGGTIVAVWSRRGSYLTFDGCVRSEITNAYFTSAYCDKCKLMYSLEKLSSYIPADKYPYYKKGKIAMEAV